MKILIVEDEESLRKDLKNLLAEGGFEVLESANGAEGLEQVNNHQNDISIIVSDYNMPEKNGIEMSEQIAKKAKIPIVILSSESSFELKDRARKVGVVLWMVKPLNKDNFIPVIKKTIERFGSKNA
ncbi:MAG: response regulator [Oligoflexales bacterium]